MTSAARPLPRDRLVFSMADPGVQQSGAFETDPFGVGVDVDIDP